MSAFDKLLSKTHLAEKNVLEEAAQDIMDAPLSQDEVLDKHNKAVMERVKQRMREELEEKKNKKEELNKEFESVGEFIDETKKFFERSDKDKESIIEMRNATLEQIEGYKSCINDLNMFLKKIDILHSAIKKIDHYKDGINKIQDKFDDAKTLIDKEVDNAVMREELAKKGVHVKPKTK